MANEEINDYALKEGESWCWTHDSDSYRNQLGKPSRDNHEVADSCFKIKCRHDDNVIEGYLRDKAKEYYTQIDTSIKYFKRYKSLEDNYFSLDGNVTFYKLIEIQATNPITFRLEPIRRPCIPLL